MKTTGLTWQVFEKGLFSKICTFENFYCTVHDLVKYYLIHLHLICPLSNLDDDKLLNDVDEDKTGSLNGFA